MVNQVSSFIREQANVFTLRDMVESTIVTGGSLQGSCLYFIGRFASNYTYKIPHALKVLEFPTMIFNIISNSLPYRAKKVCSKVKILVPILSIAAVTLVANYGYNAVSMWAIKGLIAGVHSLAISNFSVTSINSHVISLRNCLSDGKSYKITYFMTALYITTTLSLTILLQNPILALTVAYPVQALARVAHDRFAAMRSPAEPEVIVQ